MQQRMYSSVPIPSQGIHPELSTVDLPPQFAHSAENWVYRDGRMRVRDGFKRMVSTATTGRPVGFVNWFDYAQANPQTIVMATTSKYYTWQDSGQQWIDLGGSLNGNETTHNIMRVYQKGASGGTTTTMYGCNGVDDNKKFVQTDGSVSAWANDPTHPSCPRAKAMMVIGDRMLLGNLSQNSDGTYSGAIGPQVVAVSNSQDPEKGYNTALIAQLQDTPGAIVSMMEMGNLQGVIYKDDAIYMATVASDVVPFTFSLKAVVPGPVSPRAVVRVSDSLHIYLATNGDVMKFDGINATPLGRHVQLAILSSWNSLLANRSHAVYDHENNEVIIFFTDINTGDCTKGLVIRIGEDPVSVWPYRFDFLKMSAAYKVLVPGGIKFSDLDGVPSGETLADMTLPLYQYNTLNSALIVGESTGGTLTHTGTVDEKFGAVIATGDGTAIPSFWEGGLNAFDKPWMYKSVAFLDLVFSPVSGAQTATITISGTNFGEGPTSESVVNVDLNTSTQHRTYHRCSGRRLSLRIDCNATQAVELNAGYLSYAQQGTR